MLEIPNMVMIGGNSRNAGKTTLACNIIRKLSYNREVTALKVTSIRPGESDKHGHHTEATFSGFTITEELNRESHKDTSAMLQAGASRVFYIRTEDTFAAQAIQSFLDTYNFSQPLICESRSLRRVLIPGLFLMMMRDPEAGSAKDISEYSGFADKVFAYDNDQLELNNFIDKLYFDNGKFVSNNNI
jgi:hypothetical protein